MKKITVRPLSENLSSINPGSYSPGIGKRMGGKFLIEVKNSSVPSKSIKLRIKRK